MESPVMNHGSHSRAKVWRYKMLFWVRRVFCSPEKGNCNCNGQTDRKRTPVALSKRGMQSRFETTLSRHCSHLV